MIKNTSTQIDYDWQSIQIAKEITIARLNSVLSSAMDGTEGKAIGEMFSAILEEVKQSFNNSDTKS